MGDGRFAMLEVNHRTVLAVSIGAQGEINSFFFPFRVTNDQSTVDLVYRMLFKLRVQRTVGFGRTSQQQYSTGVFIQPMDDP